MTKLLLGLAVVALLASCGGDSDEPAAKPEDGQAVIQYPDGSTSIEEVTLTYDCDDGRKLILGNNRWRFDDGEWQTGEPPLFTICKPR